ncbi:transcriptional regulator [Anaerobacillus alkalidiazotrophicus]|uniref:Transcriptional regulator n=1 Tax=Anaerobacillus alkalidiazotrophicus TaxID=472963 RepID=A0A1S2M6X7_9BACI|nr:transcriptional regulator [Anaerobacillus alkalidiazotrophicus]OIJ19425.1 transcriptional regulator [Anaerobacillus alkalidiazotrophicus]
MTTFELYVLFPLIILILLLQSTLLFIDAKKKRGFAWFWGLWGLIQFPLPLLFYFIFVILPHKRKQNKER